MDSQNMNGFGSQKEQQFKQKEQQLTDAPGFGGGSGEFKFHFSDDAHYDEFMRRPRSQAYLEAMQLIDMMSADDEAIIERLAELVDEDTLEEFREMTPEEILEELRLSFEEEFAAASLEFKDTPLPPAPEAVITKCFIDGCDVHAIDGMGNIIRHYRKGETVKKEIQRGRVLYFANPGCQCVEVYTDCCRVVMPDGSVTKVSNDDIEA